MQRARQPVGRGAPADRRRLPRRGVRGPRRGAGLRGEDAVRGPELPDDPTPEQVEAWIELAELVQDDDFSASIRRMSEQHAAARGGGARSGRRGHARRRRAGGRARRARPRGRRPARTLEAAAVLGVIAPAFAGPGEARPTRPGAPGSPTASRAAPDARADRYWQLRRSSTAGRPSRPRSPAWEWTIAALRAG